MIDKLPRANPGIPVLDIIQHTQTVFDRILFVAFAEDRGLLPKNTLKDAFETRYAVNPQPVWDSFKGLFDAIDKGSPLQNIAGYNGGLFGHNEQLNRLILSDTLCEGFKRIGEYDFESDVSVNILGHIFEQSITAALTSSTRFSVLKYPISHCLVKAWKRQAKNLASNPR